jgi:hypothetical protein
MWAYNGTDRTFSVDELGNVSVTGSITIAAGSTGVANLSDAGTLAGKNSADWATEVAGTGKPANNADVTGDNTAASIAGQGSLATLNSVDWNSTLDNIPARVSDTATTGLNLTDTYIGYYDGTDFKTYIQSNGNFHFGGASSNFIDFNGTQLVIDTPELSVDGSGNATFGGALNAATGTFSGELTAATGTFSGALSAATGTFSGDLSAVGGTFAGTLDASSISTGTLDVARLANIGSAQIADGAIINAKIGNAQITTAKIDDAQVDTLQIRGNAVTFPRGVQSGSYMSFGRSGTWVTVLSLYVYEATGAPLIVSFSGPATGLNVDIRLVVDGSQVFYAGDVVPRYMSGLSGPDNDPEYESSGMVSISHYTPNTSSGTVSVSVQMRAAYGGIFARSMSVLEAKR